jgi:hypothetical protein
MSKFWATIKSCLRTNYNVGRHARLMPLPPYDPKLAPRFVPNIKDHPMISRDEFMSLLRPRGDIDPEQCLCGKFSSKDCTISKSDCCLEKRKKN